MKEASLRWFGHVMRRCEHLARDGFKRGRSTTTTNPVYSHKVSSREGKIYTVHTATSEEVERLFPIDPQLRIENSTQGHSET